MDIEKISEHKSHQGLQSRYKHRSSILNCDMHFSIFLPPQYKQERVPVIYWLSGLTCSDENFVHKAGAQKHAAKLGIAIICPDTSPRGEKVANDAADDLGIGAGFYVNAALPPWKTHYNMFDYISIELPQIIAASFPNIDYKKTSIMGHSMGGHGALIMALRNSDNFYSVSAFAPISSPCQCDWGRKAFSNYLGDDQKLWQQYDSVELLKNGALPIPTLIDQGDADPFLKSQLKPWLLQEAAQNANFPMLVILRRNYDHSYFYIATFINEHLNFHHLHLKSR